MRTRAEATCYCPSGQMQQSEDKKILLTNVPCRHRREEEEEEHKIKVNFYSKKQLSLIIYKNKR